MVESRRSRRCPRLMKATARYIHQETKGIQEAMDRNQAAREARLARTRHTSRHIAEGANLLLLKN
jgi:hypothetical protein